MVHLTLSVDVGASQTKCVFRHNQDSLSYLRVSSAVTAIAPAALKSHLELNQAIGEIRPFDQAWVEVRGEKEYQAVGLLAENLQSISRLQALKYEGALYKILAAVGSIAQDDQLPQRFSLSLIVLLPYSESSSKNLLKPELEKALKSFKFRGQIYQVELEHFICFPEGLGLLALRNREAHLPSIEYSTIAVCMLGHRNASLLNFEHRVLQSGSTTDLGFHQLVQWVCDRSAGQDVAKLTPILYEALAANRPATLRSAIRSRQEKNIDRELKQLEEAVQLAQQEYWRKLQQWLDEVIASDLDEVIVAGGAALCFKPQLEQYFRPISIYWGQKPQAVLVQDFEWDQISAFRFLDSYGSFLELQSLRKETA